MIEGDRMRLFNACIHHLVFQRKFAKKLSFNCNISISNNVFSSHSNCFAIDRRFSTVASSALPTTSPSSFIKPTELLRNVAIIAHVDHGKTTLVDALLRQSGITTESQERLMDCNALEKERGITILAKVTTITKDSYRINVVDTPGHADFGGEVERILSMVDGVVLVVDAVEGPMAQTKFVLSKALKRNLCPLVVINKVDRPNARLDEVNCELLDLFMALGATDEQLSYQTIYASARDGWASLLPPQPTQSAKNHDLQSLDAQKSMHVLFDTIIERISPPAVDRSKPFSLLVNSLEGNPYLGKCSLGRIETGYLRIGDTVKVLNGQSTMSTFALNDPAVEMGKISKIFIRRGLVQVPVEEAAAGDIVTIAGVANTGVNSTVCAPEVTTSLPFSPIDPPTISMIFSVNSSPFHGQEGKPLTSQMLGERLRRECENNVALTLNTHTKTDTFEIFGRGELQMGILIETLRREGMELTISPPTVIYKINSVNGEREEPIEEVTIDVDVEYSGVVIEKLAKRKGELCKMNEYSGKTRLVFNCPTRGLIGYMTEFKNDTRGTGVLNHSFLRYESYKGKLEFTRKGAMISMTEGVTSSYSLQDLEARGTLFVGPGVKVYPGMVIGECNKSDDLDVNPVKTKPLTNVRASSKDEFVRLQPSRAMSLEETIAYLADDEMIEVTPKSIRLRKKILDSNVRRAIKKGKGIGNQ